MRENRHKDRRVEQRGLKAKIAQLLKEYPYIAAAYQFGSAVRAQNGPMSDLDIAILLNDRGNNVPSGTELMREESLLSYKLSTILGKREIDLIDINHQNLTFQHTILRTGKLIYDGDPDFRIKFEWKVITWYLDFQPTLKLINRFHTAGRLRRIGVR